MLCDVSLCKFYGREHKPAVAVDTGNQTSASIQGTPTLTCQGTSTPLYSSIENSGGSHGRPARRCRVRVVDIDDAPASADVLRTCPPLLALCQCIHHCWCYSFYSRLLLFVIFTLTVSAFSDLTLLVGRQEGHRACKNWVVRYWRGYLSGVEWGVNDLQMVHLMPLLPPSSLAPVKSRMVYLSGAELPR